MGTLGSGGQWRCGWAPTVAALWWGPRQTQRLAHGACAASKLRGWLVSCFHPHEQAPGCGNLDRPAVSLALCGAGDVLVSAGSFLEKGGLGSGQLVSPRGWPSSTFCRGPSLGPAEHFRVYARSGGLLQVDGLISMVKFHKTSGPLTGGSKGIGLLINANCKIFI